MRCWSYLDFISIPTKEGFTRFTSDSIKVESQCFITTNSAFPTFLLWLTLNAWQIIWFLSVWVRVRYNRIGKIFCYKCRMEETVRCLLPTVADQTCNCVQSKPEWFPHEFILSPSSSPLIASRTCKSSLASSISLEFTIKNLHPCKISTHKIHHNSSQYCLKSQDTLLTWLWQLVKTFST